MRIFALLIAALAALPANAEPFRLIVTSPEAPLAPNSVQHLAEELGYFDAEGVDVELVPVQQTPTAIAALRAGEGDMANISTEAVLQLVARNQMDVRAVASPDKAIPFLIAGKQEIREVGELKGRSFAIGRPGSLDASLSSRVLEAQGVDPESLDFVALGQPSVRAQALAAGRVDATTISLGVWLSLPGKEGLHVIVPPDAYFAAAPLVSKVNVVSANVLRERPEEVQAVLRALVKASRDFAADPSAWVAAMEAARPDVPRQDLERLADSFAGSWSVNGGLDMPDLQETADYISQSEELADVDVPPVQEWVDFIPLDAVLAEIGTQAGGDPARR